MNKNNIINKYHGLCNERQCNFPWSAQIVTPDFLEKKVYYKTVFSHEHIQNIIYKETTVTVQLIECFFLSITNLLGM